MGTGMGVSGWMKGTEQEGKKRNNINRRRISDNARGLGDRIALHDTQRTDHTRTWGYVRDAGKIRELL